MGGLPSALLLNLNPIIILFLFYYKFKPIPRPSVTHPDQLLSISISTKSPVPGISSLSKHSYTLT